ncbi:MAG: hypothetical protein CMN84_02915 [Spongiibacteraceae bacterium]|jgi:polyisoprenoid-binding protein YceI|nr:hypothetical protein [Spongiibacteraceae bacterium]
MTKTLIAATTLTAATLLLGACGPSSQQQTTAAPIELKVPAGQYKHDPYHSTLAFSVNHLGLSNYIMRFTDYDIQVDLNPNNISQSSLTVTIDASSIDTDYTGDYQATHEKSPFTTWEEDLTQSPKFLNASEYPTITYTSTGITKKGDKLEIDGNLTLLGQTHPVTLEATLVGQEPQHPFFGFGALGFSVNGSFERSQFGMTHLTKPPLVSDTVTVNFEGELHQVVKQAAK